jgi:hypothetical protein
MKTSVIAGCLLLALPVFAKDKPEDFNQTAHLVSAQTEHSTSTTYDASTQRVSHETNSTHYSAVSIGKVVYALMGDCKEAVVGNDYPAKLTGDRLDLLIGDGKVCKFRIHGVVER